MLYYSVTSCLSLINLLPTMKHWSNDTLHIGNLHDIYNPVVTTKHFKMAVQENALAWVLAYAYAPA